MVFKCIKHDLIVQPVSLKIKTYAKTSETATYGFRFLSITC